MAEEDRAVGTNTDGVVLRACLEVESRVTAAGGAAVGTAVAGEEGEEEGGAGMGGVGTIRFLFHFIPPSHSPLA
jgi:hypothetical protein